MTLNGQQRKAMANPIMTVSKLRLSEMMGQLSDLDMEQVERAIRVQLALD